MDEPEQPPQPVTVQDVRRWAEEQIRIEEAKGWPAYGDVGPVTMTPRARGRWQLAKALIAFIDAEIEER